MIKKKSLILSLVVILLNFPTQSFSYSLNNFQQLATLNQESGEGSSGNSNEESNGESGGGSTENGNSNDEAGNNNVELDGAIGQWEPENNELPNFESDDNLVSIENRPTRGSYFTISATVPLQMDFLIKNQNENGSSPYGKFITPYYNIKNNGSYPLYIEVESFEDAQSNRTSDLVDGPLEKLYVAEPQSGNRKVEMRLHLTYDRVSNSYLNKIDLHSLNKNAKASMRTLGTIDPNEVARLYYGSDLWETPKSENIQTGVASTFKLKLAFSLKKDINDNTNSESGTDTGTEGNNDTTIQ